MDDWKNWEGRFIDQRFRLSRYLGGGSHSAVFATEYNGADAAIKLIPPTDHLPEWELAKQLDQPNLLRLYEAGRSTEQDTHYMVMEYADDDLSKVLPVRPLSEPETSEVVPPLLNALSYLHQQGLVHAHLKPSNILAVGDRLKISTDRVTKAGEHSQTPKSVYDAPEIAATGYTPASDIWALGVTLNEILTQRATAQPNYGKLPTRYADLIRRCLSTDPQQRPSPAEIPGILSGKTLPEPPRPISPGPPEASEERTRAVAASRRNVAILAGLALVSAAVLIGPRLVDRSPAPVAATAPPAATTPPVNTAAPADASGEVVDRVLPAIDSKARRSVRGRLRVRVRVNVDEWGAVNNAKIESRGGSRYFADRSLEAARKWKFKPPVVNGKNAPSEWNLTFEFTRAETRATGKPL